MEHEVKISGDNIELAVQRGMRPFMDKLDDHEKQDDKKFKDGEDRFIHIQESLHDINYALNGDKYNNGIAKDLKEIKYSYILAKAIIAIFLAVSAIAGIYEAFVK